MNDRDRLINLLETEIECDKDGHGDCSMCENEYAGDKCVRHIAELTADHLLANGVICPSCKVGDKVYTYGARRVKEWEITFVGKNSRNEYKFIAVVGKCEELLNFWHWEIGETVFLTKEQAEEKLKELGK